MRLSMQLLYLVWVASISRLLCAGTPLASLEKPTVFSLTGTSVHSPRSIEPAESNDNKKSEDQSDESVADEDIEEGEESEDAGEEEEDYSTVDPSTESIDFVDSSNLDALAKGILGSNDNKESVVPCFGTWWPSNGGYVYYYEDYGNGGDLPNGGGGTGGEGSDDYGDYSRRSRSRRSRRRRRMRRNRARRARTSKRTAKKKA